MPFNFTIDPAQDAWTVHLGAAILFDGGNVYDALFLAAAAALAETAVPSDRRARSGGCDVGSSAATSSGLDPGNLSGDWDDGERLIVDGSWPVCVILMSYVFSVRARLGRV